MISRITLVTFVAAAAAVANAKPLQVRMSDGPTAGRIIIDLGTETKATIRQHGNHVQVGVGNDLQIVTPPRVPRNVISFAGGQGAARFVISAGSRLKSLQTGGRLTLEIIDVRARQKIHDGTEVGRTNPDWKPEPTPASVDKPGPVSATTLVAPSPAATPIASPASAQHDDALPPLPKFEPIEVPAPPEIGAVAFRRGDSGVVVFDGRLDTSGIEANADPRRLTVHRLPNGTVLLIKLSPSEQISLDHRTYGWQVAVENAVPHPASQTAAPTKIDFEFGQSGHAISIADPLTDQTLLLGTLRHSTGDRLMIADRREAPGYVLLPTWLGLAVSVSSDAVDLQPTETGFTLQVPDHSAPGAAIVRKPSNDLDIPQDAVAVLQQRLSGQIASAAEAPPRDRGAQRVAAAKTMLALGFDAEAQALLTLAANDDPTLATNPKTAELSAAAAILAGRPGEATSLDSPALPAGGDVAMWRGLRDQALGEPVPHLGGSWPLLSTYPAAIRDRIGPTIIEAAVREGIAVPPTLLDGPAYAFARALKMEQTGDGDGALQAFDALANSRDELVSVRAAVEATNLRLAKGKLTPKEAADRIEQQTVRWRGDRREMTMKLRVAELRQAAGQWHAALSALQEVKNLFPDTADLIARQEARLFHNLVDADTSSISPLELVTIAGDYADSLPSGAEGDRLAGLLADKLVALDLPSRAKPVLEQLIAKAGSPAARAAFSLRLGQVDLDAGDARTAEQVLRSIDSGLLPAAQAEQRNLLLARAASSRGDSAAAAALLSDDDTPTAEEVRADYLAKAGDWKGSFEILNLLISATIPSQGELTEKQQDLLLRAATAAVQSGNAQAIATLSGYQNRIKNPRADLFRVLTQSAIGSSTDLERASRELAMAREVPQLLNQLETRREHD